MFLIFCLGFFEEKTRNPRPKNPSRPGFCASFGCCDSRGWPACCGPCRSPGSKCLEECWRVEMLRSLSFDPGYIGVGELNFYVSGLNRFLKRKISPKRKGSWVFLAGLARLPPLFQGSHGSRTFKTPEVDDFDQRNGSSYHLRHLEMKISWTSRFV